MKRINSLTLKGIVILTTCFACNTDEKQAINREQFIIEHYNEYPLFAKGFYFRDSIKNMNDILIPSKFIYDSVNRLFLEKHFLFVDYCNINTFFIINNLVDKYFFLPFPDERLAIQNIIKNGSVVNENTFFCKELLKFIKVNNLKNNEYFLSCVFDSLLRAKPVKLSEIKFQDEVQKDSVFTALELNKVKKVNIYESVQGNKAYWAIIYNNNDVKVCFVNSNNIECIFF